jgi:ribonuclease G
MQKELIIATTSQETKVAILENDELVEYSIERHRSQGIVGNIYKGKVTKVLPGMQSAFVDIGLERDAFLYVSDFFEDTEEYEKIVSTVEEEVSELQEAPQSAPRKEQPREAPRAPVSEPSTVEVAAGAAEGVSEEAMAAPASPETVAAPAADEGFDRRGPRRGRDRDRGDRGDRGDRSDRGDRGGRDRDHRGGGDRGRDRGGRNRPRIPSFEAKTYESREPRESRGEDRGYSGIEALPGESLAKYANRPHVMPFSDSESGVSERSAGSAPQDVEEMSEGRSAADTLADAVTEDRENTNTAEEITISQPASATPEESTADEADADARISDRSHERSFAYRPSRRPRRRSDNDAPPKSDSQRPSGGGGGGHVSRGAPTIAELLREGQEILVQVSKEPLGKKGARITSHIALPGRYLVYMPTVDHVGVSRKIASDEERMRLKRIINENRTNLPGGFIVRTAAEGRSEAEFVQDIRFLGNLWSDIRAKSEKKSAPAMIHRDLNLVQRILRDQLSQDFSAIRLDNEQEFATVLDFVNKFQPALVNRVKLHLKDTPIFEEHGLTNEIDKALRSKVWLKSGGYIVINQTEALVAIDVNTGKYVGRSNRLEDTIVRTNLDAVHEIVRQIRLRNLGGIIVVDFIDMEERKNRQRVMAALEEEIRSDKVPSKILQFNDFGLVAITRKRTQPSLERTVCAPCAHCNGSGWVKAPETVCYDIQQEIKKMASTLDGKEVTIRVNPEVAKALKSGEFVSIQDLEEWTKRDVVVKSDPLLHEEHFDIF